MDPKITYEIESGDVIRLILQFLYENRLEESFHTLARETQVSLTGFSDRERFLEGLKTGEWEMVMEKLPYFSLSFEFQVKIYQQIVYELVEVEENDIARALVEKIKCMKQWKRGNGREYKELEEIMNSDTNGNSEKIIREIWRIKSKQERRDELYDKIKDKIKTVQPSKLLNMIGQALKWQRFQGALPIENPMYDFLTDEIAVFKIDAKDLPVCRKTNSKIKLGKKSPVLVAEYSLDGNMLFLGTKDGFIEIYDTIKYKLREDLEYQKNDEPMMHEGSVTALCFHHNGEIVATGDSQGEIKQWDIGSGKCKQRYKNTNYDCTNTKELSTNEQHISSLCYTANGQQLLYTVGRSICILGCKSNACLKIFQGHSETVKEAIFFANDTKIISCSNDSTIRIWEVSSAQCIKGIKIPSITPGVDVDILSVKEIHGRFLSKHETQNFLLVCTRSPRIYILDFNGKIMQIFQNEEMSSLNDSKPADFVACEISRKGKYVYAADEKHNLITFDLEKSVSNANITLTSDQATIGREGMVTMPIEVSPDDVYGIKCHPHRNIMAIYGADGYVRIWKAKEN